MSRRLFSVALLTTILVMSVLVAPAQSAAPGKKKWLKDTRAAMYGSRAFIDSRVEPGDTKLVVNLDIDNTSLATYYKRGKAVPVVLRFARYANSKGVHVYFNTGRNVKDLNQAVAGLRRNGYPVSSICGRRPGESLTTSKQRCRQQLVDRGYTIIANVGNRSTDFVGSNYERAFKLPNYGNRLG
ncbi:MAG: HAD family acid phosphatase [Marmoricola sp.]